MTSEPQLYVLTPTGVHNGVGFRLLSGLGLRQQPYDRIGNGLVAPVDFDATNGQDFYIADGARVLRFSEEGQLVQVLDIPAVDRVMEATAAIPGEAVAVAAGVEGRVYVAEAARGTVQIWRDGSLANVIRGVGEPRSLATDGRRLFVADGSAPIIREFDRDGRPVRELRHEALPSLTSISLWNGTVVALGPAVVVLFSSEEETRVVPVSGGATLLDAVVQDDALLVLTPTLVHLLGLLD